MRKRLVSSSIPTFAARCWAADALLACLVRLCIVPGCEHSTEEPGPSTIGNHNDVSSGHFVVPTLMFVVEYDPDDSNTEGYCGYEATDDFARDGDGHARFVAFVVNDGDAGNPFSKRASEEAGRDDEVCEKDEHIDDPGLWAEDATARDRSDHENDHEEDSDVNRKGVEAAKWTSEFKTQSFDGFGVRSCRLFGWDRIRCVMNRFFRMSRARSVTASRGGHVGDLRLYRLSGMCRELQKPSRLFRSVDPIQIA